LGLKEVWFLDAALGLRDSLGLRNFGLGLGTALRLRASMGLRAAVILDRRAVSLRHARVVDRADRLAATDLLVGGGVHGDLKLRIKGNESDHRLQLLRSESRT
jgi:hypothetical protein